MRQSETKGRRDRQMKLKKKVCSKPYPNPLSVKDYTSLQKSLSAISTHYDPGKSKNHGIVALVTASFFVKISQQ